MGETEANARANSEFVIEEVTDVAAAWAELEPLVLGIINYHQPWDPRTLRADWQTRIRDHMASGFTLISRAGDRTASGFFSGRITRDFGIFEEVVAHVDNAFVVDGERRRGVGTALLRRFEELSRSHGATEVRLSAVAANQIGLSFWAKSGFGVLHHVMRKRLEGT